MYDKENRADQLTSKPFSSQYDEYHPLIMGINEVFALTEHQENFPKSAKIKKDITKKDRTKYCAFHHDIDHNTANCFNLKEAIEALIRRAKLQKYRADNH